MVECWVGAVSWGSWMLIVGGASYLVQQRRTCTKYGRYSPAQSRCCPARFAWLLQEVPAFLVPLLLMLLDSGPETRTGRMLLLWTFMLHYFHRSFIYGLLTRGRPVPLNIVISSFIFCTFNGFLQGHNLLHCARLHNTWLSHARITSGSLLFLGGLIMNIHSDYILRNLRKPGEVDYRIPRGGMFEFVSGANFLGEIIEWCGYAIAAWSLPAFAFAFFTVCSIGPRAYQHHRDYQQRFRDYPRSRKALIPFIF
ncbi:3-oxo-5-alpha-steroid 4-dehydrogenase 2 [Austrofundulus limnaeus]|uniref:3-oxo-5alpha-steroid 4-dehydrogenase (NADP(+)) n=1 Tax=Austrofundulus limnaeus TaxID=52670 RepID=A0A2I4CXD3_AUSLI|nr:PREDICTED: 3-oxo-5-alpha-steroid 4-dehydrogenase 2-like [Austrofundulus limnaeus]